MKALPQAQFTGQFFNYRSPELNREIVAEYIGKDAAGSTFFVLHIDENNAVEKAFADWEIVLPYVRRRFTKIEVVADVTNERVTNTIETRIEKYRVKVKKWLTKKAENPVPMREMIATVERETARAFFVTLNGFIAPSSHCLHCGRKLRHPVSLLYGIGPVCGEHFHINPLSSEEELQARYEEMSKAMGEVTWKGWIPRSQIEQMVVQA